MTSKIVKCNCAHSMQDEINGVGNRNANEMKDGRFRCTVCGTIHGSGAATAVKVKEQPVQQKKAVEKEVVDKKKDGKKASLKGNKR
jgi:hypothetical protein